MLLTPTAGDTCRITDPSSAQTQRSSRNVDVVCAGTRRPNAWALAPLEKPESDYDRRQQ